MLYGFTLFDSIVNVIELETQVSSPKLRRIPKKKSLRFGLIWHSCLKGLFWFSHWDFENTLESPGKLRKKVQIFYSLHDLLRLEGGPQYFIPTTNRSLSQPQEWKCQWKWNLIFFLDSTSLHKKSLNQSKLHCAKIWLDVAKHFCV